MTFRPWRAAALLAPAAIAAVAMATPASAASPSWQLTDQYTASPACYTTGGGSEYLEVNLNGSWSPLTYGASGLPGRRLRQRHRPVLLQRHLRGDLRQPRPHTGGLQQRHRPLHRHPDDLRRGLRHHRHPGRPRGELHAEHHLLGQRRHHQANRNRPHRDQDQLQASILNARSSGVPRQKPGAGHRAVFPGTSRPGEGAIDERAEHAIAVSWHQVTEAKGGHVRDGRCNAACGAVPRSAPCAAPGSSALTCLHLPGVMGTDSAPRCFYVLRFPVGSVLHCSSRRRNRSGSLHQHLLARPCQWSMVRVNFWVACWPLESLSRMVKV